MIRKLGFILVVLVAAALFTSGCTEILGGGNQTPTPVPTPTVNQTLARLNLTVYQAAENRTNLTTFVAAVDAAGLNETLNGSGPFTVFAPTDAAFAALPQDALVQLLANEENLTQVLLSHVVAGNISANVLANQTNLTTFAGTRVDINVTGGRLMVENATIIESIPATNGVLYVVDQVIITNETEQWFGVAPTPTPTPEGNATPAATPA
jgi:transforming growth factor-beta-induced protein